MKNLILKILHSNVTTLIFIIVYPFVLKLLPVFNPKYFEGYNEIIGAFFSGIAIIIAFVTIYEQRRSFQRQNTRLDYSVKVEAISKAIEIRELLFKHDPEMQYNEKEKAFLASLYEKLDKESLVMIEKIEKESFMNENINNLK